MVSYQLTTSQERATLRAVVEGVQAQALSEGRYLTTSVSRPGSFHVTTADSCTCEAGQRGIGCKHRAAVLLAAESHTCHHCGRTAQDVVSFCEHVGGRGDVTIWCCNDRRACWVRWERQHAIDLAREDREIEWGMDR